MSALSDFVAHCLVYRLGWSLVHSLWQVAAAAGLLAAVLAVVPRRRANMRYALACAALLAALGAFAATLAMSSPPQEAASAEVVAAPGASAGPSPGPAAGMFDAAPPPLAWPPDVAPAAPPPVAPLAPPAPVEPASLLDGIRAALTPALPWAVLAWTTGVLLMGLWHAGGLAVTVRLRRLGTCPPGREVSAAIRKVAERLNIRRAVGVLVCARPVGTMVLGVIRPVILMPAALLTGMTPGQLEALLAHELAHIRRRDYLVNLIQTAVESILFYHPATWWIGRVIRRERENCCDDLASAAAGSRFEYARALAAAANFARPPARPRFALAAEGGSLIQRVQRLLTPTGGTRRDILRRSALAGLLAVGIAVAIVGCSLGGGPRPAAPADAAPAGQAPQMRIAAVTDANGQYDVEFRLPDGASQPRLRVEAGKLARMTIGRDDAERQSLSVTVTHVRGRPPAVVAADATERVPPRRVVVTYHVILAVKGGFRQWTQKNVPWPLGEWKALAEGLDLATEAPELLGVWRLIERNGAKVDGFAAAAIDAAGNMSTVEFDAAGKMDGSACQAFAYALKPGRRMVLNPGGLLEA